MDREPEPPVTLTAAMRAAAFRERPDPIRRPPEAPSPEQLAAEMADRVVWAEWNSKKTRRAVRANQMRQKYVMAQRLDELFDDHEMGEKA